VLVAAAVQVLGVLWAPLRELLDVEVVPAGTFGLLVLLSAVPGLVLAAQRRWLHRRDPLVS
jgi:hypothetical protein